LGARVVWATIAVFVTAFALTPVLLSHDAFSYLDYARLGVVHDLNPYLHAPDAAPSDPVFADVTWTETTSAYGPLFTLLTYPLAWLPVGVAVAALKALAALSVLALAALVARLAAWRGVEPLRAAAFVALNPLVLVHVVGGAHNDGLTMLLAMLGVAALLSAREASGGAALIAAAATKASALFVAPFALAATARPKAVRPPGLTGLKYKEERDLRPINPGVGLDGGGFGRLGRFALGAAAAAVAIGLTGYLAFGWEWTQAFGLAGENQSHASFMSIPITFARLTGLDADPVRAAALVLYALALAFLLRHTWRGGDLVRDAGWAAVGLLLATSWLLPWYLVWPLPLAAISRDRPLQLLTLALTAFQLGTRIPL
jgi:hypothetical protein